MSEYKNTLLSTDELPQISAVHYLPLAKNYRLLSLIDTLTSWLFIWFALILFGVFLKALSIPSWSWPILASITTLSAIYSLIAANSKGYALRDKDVIYKEGLWWKKRTGISYKRVQHIDISHGPLERYFGMATIKLFTAGGASADLKIPGLPKSLAESIRQHMVQRTSAINA